MGITVFASLAVLSLLTFTVFLRRIHLFEAILVWGLLVFLHSNFLWLVGMNGKYIDIDESVSMILAITVMSKIVVPILVFHAFAISLMFRKAVVKLVVFVLLVGVLLGMDGLAVRLNVMAFSPEWKIGYSILYRGGTVAVAFAAWQWIRTVARREIRL
ncbi:hypothetical protein FHS18_002669 [Paenibacillus phyllosphaerae]|uniref:Uncharacterized protein n=1 Tax=Paenibacillus phyllosphaerae TaxID=274593 RepID=A0A7W5AXM0_9BACL|nr:hypothetical protein [Paenibacillus phyllosphaerae]MBB3110602.1 hypothetical protein [Paenibacillus phyllosphaerae]